MSDSNTLIVIDLSQLCPHCGQSNQCAIAMGGDAADCWCMKVKIDERQLVGLPTDLDASSNMRCICQNCAQN